MRFLALLAFALLVACGRVPEFAPLPAGAPVLCFGDSVTHGTGAGAGEDYPTRLAELTGWDIHNAGIPGDTADRAKGRIRAVLEQTQPKLVLVEIGGNDFLRRRPEAAVREDIRQILAAVRAFGAQPVLVAVPRFSIVGAVVGALPDAELYAELAAQEKVPLVDKVFAGVLSDESLKTDQIHPNAAGYRALAEGIAARLARVGLLVAPR
jgi:acyl-CoA hydrolase